MQHHPLEDGELGTVLATAGRQTVDGTTALNYVRARTIESEGNGDYGRIKRQQLFLASLMRSIISTETLFNIERLDGVVNTLHRGHLRRQRQDRDLVQLRQSLQGINAGHITFVTLPTTGQPDDEGNEVPHTRHPGAVRRNHRRQATARRDDNNETLSRWTAATMSTATTSESVSPESSADISSGVESDQLLTTTERVKVVAGDPRDITMQVGNATETAGLATAAAQEFEAYGFKVLDPDYSDWGNQVDHDRLLLPR